MKTYKELMVTGKLACFYLCRSRFIDFFFFTSFKIFGTDKYMHFKVLDF